MRVDADRMPGGLVDDGRAGVAAGRVGLVAHRGGVGDLRTRVGLLRLAPVSLVAVRSETGDPDRAGGAVTIPSWKNEPCTSPACFPLVALRSVFDVHQSLPTPPSTRATVGVLTTDWSWGPGCWIAPVELEGGTLNWIVWKLAVQQWPADRKQFTEEMSHAVHPIGTTLALRASVEGMRSSTGPHWLAGAITGGSSTPASRNLVATRTPVAPGPAVRRTSSRSPFR